MSVVNSMGSGYYNHYNIENRYKCDTPYKDSFTKEILKADKGTEKKINNIDNKKDNNEEGNITSKIITMADGTRMLILTKNSSIVTQIKLGKALDEYKEENLENRFNEKDSFSLTQATIESEEISSMDQI